MSFITEDDPVWWARLVPTVAAILLIYWVRGC